MKRRNFLQLASLGGAAGLAGAAPRAKGDTPPLKITRVRFYLNPSSPVLFNQSFHIVTIETDQGITGVGEGGSKDTIEQCAAMIIGEDPSRIDHLWQMMFRGYFYPAGREKLDALGAIDLALWDIKGKALGVPVYDLLGGAIPRPRGVLFHGVPLPWQLEGIGARLHRGRLSRLSLRHGRSAAGGTLQLACDG